MIKYSFNRCDEPVNSKAMNPISSIQRQEVFDVLRWGNLFLTCSIQIIGIILDELVGVFLSMKKDSAFTRLEWKKFATPEYYNPFIFDIWSFM